MTVNCMLNEEQVRECGTVCGFRISFNSEINSRRLLRQLKTNDKFEVKLAPAIFHYHDEIVV